MIKGIKEITISILVFAMVLVFNNCSDVKFENAGQPQESTGDLGDPDPTPNPTSYPFELSFEVGSAEYTKVDIIFLVDTSGSMQAEQAELGLRFSNFINSISALDWRVGILTMNIENGPNAPEGSHGQLIPFNSAGLNYIDSNTPNAQSLFENHIFRPESNPSNSVDDERGIYNANLFLDTSVSQAFLRESAKLHIVLLSDENERSSGNNLADYDLPATIINKANSLVSSFTAHAIITEPNDNYCADHGGTNNFGTIYKQLADMTGGVVGSVCADDYSAQLESIGQVVNETTRRFELPCAPLEYSFTLTPAPTEEFYAVVDANVLTFNDWLPEGTLVSIKGSCEPGHP